MQQLHRDKLMSTRDDLMSLSDIVLCLYKWPTDAPHECVYQFPAATIERKCYIYINIHLDYLCI